MYLNEEEPEEVRIERERQNATRPRIQPLPQVDMSGERLEPIRLRPGE